MKYLYLFLILLAAVNVQAQTVLTVPTGGGTALSTFPHSGTQIVVNKGVMLPDTNAGGYLRYTPGYGLTWSDVTTRSEGKGAGTQGNTTIYGTLTVTGSTYLSTTPGSSTYIYGPLVNSYGGGKTVQEITDASIPYSYPTGVNGQVLYVHNADVNPTTGDVTIPAGDTWGFVYTGGSWQHLK